MVSAVGDNVFRTKAFMNFDFAPEKYLSVVKYDVVIPYLTVHQIFYVMYCWLMLLGNGSYDLFPGRLNVVMK